LLKPNDRLGRKLMATPRQDEKVIEFLKKLFGPPRLITKVFSLGFSNFSLNATLMKPAEQGLGIRPQVKTVKIESLAIGIRHRIFKYHRLRGHRPQLYILPSTEFCLMLKARQ
jgi:hypothetical protein